MTILNLSSYAFDFWSIPLALSAAFAGEIGLLVVLRERRSVASLLFCVLSAFAAGWLASFACLFLAIRAEALWFWAKAGAAFAAFLPAAAYHFTSHLLSLDARSKRVVWLSWILSAIFALSVLQTSDFISGFWTYAWGVYPRHGWIGTLFAGYSFLMLVMTLFQFWREGRRARPGTVYSRRTKIFFAAFLIAGFSTVDFLPKSGFDVYPLGFVPVLLFNLAAGYAIWRYRLVDITAAFAAGQIIGTMGDALIVCDRERRMCVVNRAACERLGYSVEELAGRAVEGLVGEHPSAREGLLAAISRGFAQDEAFVFLTKSGEAVEVRVSVSTIESHDGEPVGYVLVARDITERLKVERTLKAVEERARLVVDAAHEAFVSMDLEGRILDWNRQAERTFGWKREEAVGRRLDETIIPERYRAAHREGVRRYVETGAGTMLNRSIEMTALYRDGREFPVEISVTPVVVGADTFFSAFVRDITERKRIEEELKALNEALEHRVRQRTSELEDQKRSLEEANRRLKELSALKDEFLAAVSHELRTPLTALKEGTALLLERVLGPVNDEQHEFLCVVDENIDRLAALISNMLDLSKIEAGRLHLNRQRVQVTELVRKTVQSYRSVAGRRTVRESLEPVPDVFADPDRLLQVFGNLFSNAVKFTKEEGTIEFLCRREKDEVILGVRDDGIGISAEDLPKLFQKFVQVGSAELRPKGTGLGLVLCKQLIELHQGTITVTSQPGQGTCFEFRLPVYTPELAFEQTLKDREAFHGTVSPERTGLVLADVVSLLPRQEGPGVASRRAQMDELAEFIHQRLHTNDTVLFIEPRWLAVMSAAGAEDVVSLEKSVRWALEEWREAVTFEKTKPLPLPMTSMVYSAGETDTRGIFEHATRLLEGAPGDSHGG